MITSWAAWILTVGIGAILGLGMWLLAYHHGYVAGRAARIGEIPGDPWRRPPSEAEFMELLERERLQPDEPRKYRREP